MKRLLWRLGLVELVWIYNLDENNPEPLLRIVYRDDNGWLYARKLLRIGSLYELLEEGKIADTLRVWKWYQPFDKPKVKSLRLVKRHERTEN